jgi:hypothetical protein
VQDGERSSQTLSELKASSHVAQTHVWMRDAGDIWEYICIYVDDLATRTCLKDPKAFFDVLMGPKYNYRLKSFGPIKYHLGGTLSWGSRKTYIKRMLKNYE